MNMVQLPEKTYERNLNHNYMIIKDEDKETDYGYQVKMLTDNHIDGLLPVSLRVENGIEHFYYEIQSKQTFERIYERRSIRYEELQMMIRSFLSLEKSLHKFLLSYDCIIIDPSFLFMDMESREVSFVYFPGFQQEARCGFMQLVEYMLTKTDHTDERAVVLIYKLYRYTRNENFVLSEIASFLEEPSGMQLSSQLSPQLAGQQIPGSTVLSGVGVAAPSNEAGTGIYPTNIQDNFWNQQKEPYPVQQGWKQEQPESYKWNPQASVQDKRNQQESAQGTWNRQEQTQDKWKQQVPHQQRQTNQNQEQQKPLQHKQPHQQQNGEGISPKVMMLLSIGMAVILLGVLAAEKWLGILPLTAKTEMFVFAGIVIFAVLGIVFNIMTVTKEKASQQDEIKRQDETKRHEETTQKNPIQFQQILPSQHKQSQFQYATGTTTPQCLQEDSTYQFFGTPGETMLMCEQEEGHMLRGCDGNGFEYKLDHFPVLIGRMKPYVDVAFEDKSVSKMHARLEERGGKVYLEDMNSTNGTKKNGELIGMNESVPLMPGDEIVFGKVKLRYC